MKNYIPRSKIITKPSGIRIIKLSIIVFILILVIILIFFTNSNNNNLVLDNQVFQGEYEKNKNFIRIDQLKFNGYNNIGNPYLLTASKAVKEMKNKDKIVLYNVQADIFINDKNWFFLNTNKAVFLISDKILFSNEKVKGFYDDGSSFTAPSIEYNFHSGIAKSKEGIVMYGKWGNIKANNFSFNSFEDKYKFKGKTVMIINKKK